MFKKFLAIFLALALLICMLPMTVFAEEVSEVAYDVWDGTFMEPVSVDSNGVIIITSAEELAWVALRGVDATVGKNYKVTDNAHFILGTADGGSTPWTLAISEGNTQAFQGNFDGNGLVVEYAFASNQSYAGLFPIVKPASGTSLTIKNVKVINSNFVGYNNAGGIVGFVNAASTNSSIVFENCEVANCYISDNNDSNAAAQKIAGGIAGTVSHNKAILRNCYVHDNEIIGTNISAGFIGSSSNYAQTAEIINSVSLGIAPEPITTTNASVGNMIKSIFTNVYTDQATSFGTQISTADIMGANAKSAMPNLDWANAWGATNELPVLRVFGGEIIEEEIGCVHSFTEYSEVAATCENDGIMAHGVCDKCGIIRVNGMETFEDYMLVIPAIGHNMQPVEGYSPTATAPGLYTHQKCEMCGGLFIDGRAVSYEELIIPPLGDTVRVITSFYVMGGYSKDSYFVGEEFDPAQTAVEVGYSDGLSERKTLADFDGYRVEGFDSSAPAELWVTITYFDYVSEFAVYIYENENSEPGGNEHEHVFGDYIIITAPTCTTPGLQEAYCSVCGASSGYQETPTLAHELTYVEGVAATDVSDGIRAHEECVMCKGCFIDGKQVSYEEIIIPAWGETPAREIIRIFVLEESSKLEYKVGEELDMSQIVVTAYYTDGTAEQKVLADLGDDVYVSDYDNQTVGTKDITVYYGNLTTQFTVTVIADTVEPPVEEKEIIAIRVYNSPYKTEYNIGEDLDLTGLVIEGIYEDKTTVLISEFDASVFRFSGFESEIAGEKLITVYYKNLNAQFSVFVAEESAECKHENMVVVAAVPATCLTEGVMGHTRCADCDSVFVDGQAVPGAYIILPKTDHVLVMHNAKPATCTDDGWAEYQTCENCDYTTYRSILAAGHNTVHIDRVEPTATDTGVMAHDECENCGALFVDGKEVTLSELIIPPITVTPERVVTGIAIGRTPLKINYFIGEAANWDGIEIVLLYNDGYSETITSGYSISELDSSTAGTKTITVSYNEFTASFRVDVSNVSENTPKLTIESKKVSVKNDQVEIVFTLSNVADITSLGIANITFDETHFALSSGVWTLPGNPALKNDYAERNGHYIASAAYSDAIDCNGAIFTLTLDILDTAEASVSTINCEFVAKNGSEAVEVYTVTGEIELTTAIRGDVDGNEVVDSNDAIYLLNYTLFPELYPLLGEHGGDIDVDYDRDGIITSNDAIYLLNYTLFPEYSPLD